MNHHVLVFVLDRFSLLIYLQHRLPYNPIFDLSCVEVSFSLKILINFIAGKIDY